MRRLDVYNRSFSSVSFSLEYEVFLGLDVVIEHRDGRRLALGPQALNGRERYLASADAEVTRTNREEAIRRISSQLAGRVHDAFYERTAVGSPTPPQLGTTGPARWVRGVPLKSTASTSNSRWRSGESVGTWCPAP